MKINKYLALLVGILALAGCAGTSNSSSVEVTPTPSDTSSEQQVEIVSLDVVKTTYKNNQEVVVEGVVYGVTKNGFFVADSASAGIFVNMGDNWTATVKIGDKVQVDAKYSLVSGYCMLKQAKVETVATNETVPVVAVEKELTFVNDLVASVNGDYGMLVKLVGTLSEGSSNTYVLTDDTGNTVTFASNSAAHLAANVGKRIIVETVVYRTDSEGKWQLVFAGDENDIVDATLTFADYVELAKEELNKLVPATCTGNLTLPTAHSIDSSMTYTWAVKSGTSVTITDAGVVVVPPTADEEVVLTVTIARGEETQTVDYTIVSKAVVEKTVAQFMGELPVSGDAVKVTGVVVAMGRNQGSTTEPFAPTKRCVVIQDEKTSASVPVNYYYSSTSHGFDGLSVGDKVTVEGTWSYTNGANDNATILAKSMNLVAENATVFDAKATAKVISSQEDYEAVAENPDQYVGQLLKFDNPYMVYSTTGDPNPSNWVKFGYDSTVSPADKRYFATLVGLGNENIDEAWHSYFNIAHSGEEGVQFAGDIYAYLVYRSDTYLQLCIPSISYIALDDANHQSVYNEVCALPDSVDSGSKLALQEDLTYTFNSDVIDASGNVSVVKANTDVEVTVTKGEKSLTKTITIISSTTYGLTVGEETNGTTTLSATTDLLENEEVTATFAPAEGYVTVSYTVTCGTNSVKYPAYNQTEATIKVPGDAVVTAEYELASKFATHNLTPYGSSGNIFWYNTETGAWTSGSSGTTARTYDYLIQKLDEDFNTELFTVEADPLSNGKWINTRGQSKDYTDSEGNKINLYTIYGAADDAAKLTLNSKHEITSIVIHYAATAHYNRATVYAGETVVKGVNLGNNSYEYLIEGSSFSIENASGSEYLYMTGIDIIYAAPAAHGYEYDAEGHWASCGACDFAVSKTAHELVDGVCVCGYSELCNVTVGTVENGTTTVSTNSAVGGSEVTVTFTPNEGYTLLSYSLTTESGTVKYSAFGKTEAKFELTGDTTVTAKYGLADAYATYSYAGGTSRAYYYVDGKFQNSDGKEYSYEDVMGSMKDAEGNKMSSELFGVTPITTFENGKWANLYYSKNGYGLSLYSSATEYSGITFTSTKTIQSVVITYYSDTYVSRASVQANDVELNATVESETVRSYVVEGNSFSITNISGGNNLYITSIEFIYEA